MSNKTNIKQGENTNVKVEAVIDFGTIDTKKRDDDGAWNAMKFFGETDAAEAGYKSPEKISKLAEERIRALKFGRSVLMEV